ncbi:hypothetical protein AAFC00_006608 [Neodothiora populina]
MASFLHLPDELLQEIFSYLPASSTASLGLVTKRLQKISNAPFLWRNHVLDTWKYWEGEKEHVKRVNGSPVSPQWRTVYAERCKKDKKIAQIFDELLSTQQYRIERMERIISQFGHDAKDALLRLVATPDHVEDVLARRYYSEALIGLLNRQDALQIWADMEFLDFPRLETSLGAFDTFVQGPHECDVRSLDQELDKIAQQIRNQIPGIEELDYTTRASTVSAELRRMELLGSSEQEYHLLRNNFMCHVLQSEHRVSLPLVSTAIFCCVAQRLGLRVWLCNFPFHVHAVLESPADPPLYETRSAETLSPGVVWMDPWRHDNIIDQDAMRIQLQQHGMSTDAFYSYLSPAFTRDMVIRTGRNIMRSVNEARDNRDEVADQEIDVDAAFYSFLWSVFLVGLNDTRESTLQRRNYIPYLLDQFKQHYPEDVGLVERFVLPIYAGHPAQSQLIDMINAHRASDHTAKPVNRRYDVAGGVKFKVGQPFRHARFHYIGIVIGWDSSCQAGEPWIMQMRVDALPRGRRQSFYHILGADKSSRYVAEENIEPLTEPPPPSLMRLAGRHFKRYDSETNMFISNIKDEYPDD